MYSKIFTTVFLSNGACLWFKLQVLAVGWRPLESRVTREKGFFCFLSFFCVYKFVYLYTQYVASYRWETSTFKGEYQSHSTEPSRTHIHICLPALFQQYFKFQAGMTFFWRCVLLSCVFREYCKTIVLWTQFWSLKIDISRFCDPTLRIARFLITISDSIFWGATFAPIKNLAILNAEKVQSFDWTLISHSDTRQSASVSIAICWGNFPPMKLSPCFRMSEWDRDIGLCDNSSLKSIMLDLIWCL